MARMIGRFEILETLGSGVQGKVKLGRDTETGDRVAVKLLPRSVLDDESARTYLEREIEAMRRSSHENIVRLYESDFDAKLPKRDGSGVKREVVMLVIELCTGGELFDYLSLCGRFEEDLARTYFRQLIFGLEAAHRAGVSHRDIKPENLLLDAEYVLKIADFGLSSISETEEGMLLRSKVGTPSYMAHEVLLRRLYSGEKADVWSSAVVLFIMLAGFPPMAIALPRDWWFNRLREGRYDRFWAAHERNASFSDGAKALLEKMFVVDPEARATIEDIKEDAWFNGEVVPNEELREELRRRQERVMAERERQREEKRRQREASGTGSRPTGRARAARSLSAERDGGGEEEPRAPPLPDDFAHRPACYTSFRSKAGVWELIDRTKDAMEDMDITYKFSTEEYSAKAKKRTPSGVIGLNVNFYEDRESGDNVVAITRRRGNALKFHQIFQQLVEEELVDLIASPE